MGNATPLERYESFRRLHEQGCFVMPNPWDIGSARVLQQLGFPALATTSAGSAWSRGRPDNGMALEEVLQHLHEIVASVDVPVNADFEACFAVEPDDVYRNVLAALATGICGVSIEDSTQQASSPLFGFELSVERVRAARKAIDDFGRPALLTARFEGYLVGVADRSEATRRLCAYSEAGADCLYAPGLRTSEEIGEIVRSVAPKPVNILVSADMATVASLAALGVRRISVGGALARKAWTGFLETAHEIATHGTFHGFSGLVPSTELNQRMVGQFPP
jgi:2-methylisocitrate lyase-like PEP mutase family enzyme